MIQIENEYGSTGICDKNYMSFLRDLAKKHLDDDVILFTVDGPYVELLKCGTIEGLYATVDFGTANKQSDVEYAFQQQRQYAPKGPLVNTEFYPGWIDHWGENWIHLDAKPILKTMQFMYNLGASFNFYMFEGATNFGFWNSGAPENDTDPLYHTMLTSHDYDAPLSEAGDPTPKFMAIRSLISNLTGVEPRPVPPATEKLDFGSVEMINLGRVNQLLPYMALPPLKTTYPPNFETIDFPYGFILYQIILNKNGHKLTFLQLRDRGYVTLDGNYAGRIVMRYKANCSIEGSYQPGQKLEVLVENQGRQNDALRHPKGLGNVTLDGQLMSEWKSFRIVPQWKQLIARYRQRARKYYSHISTGRSSSKDYMRFIPSVFMGKFNVSTIADTYFNPMNWTKGQLYINGFNVGRYWPSWGPQVTLYVPKTVLKLGSNFLMMLELEGPGNCLTAGRMSKCLVGFSTVPYLDKPITD